MGIHVSRYIEDGCIFFVFNLGFKVIFFFFKCQLCRRILVFNRYYRGI